MSETLRRIRELVASGEVKISGHGYDELAADGLFADEVVATVADALVVEDYPDFPKGPCVLVLQKNAADEPVHVVWGGPKNAVTPAVVVTAYRPDPKRWTEDFLRRLT